MRALPDVRSSLLMTTIALSLRFDLAAIFLCAGAVKRLRPAEFETALRKYRLLPSNLVHAGATAVPLVELGLGAALAAGLLVTEISVALSGLLISFAALVAWNLIRGRSFDCGCGVSLVQRSISWPLVAQDLALAAAAFFVAFRAPRVLALDGLVGAPSKNADMWAPALILSLLLLILAALTRESIASWRSLQ